MPFRKTHYRLEQLRQQPEDVRLRAALTITIGIGILLVFITLAILLPIQLYLT